ncbi:MAG: YgiQ family radical SAM protein [Candidatus Electrothrix scaldis]|nr:MAG: YgiQ family radical SAM protein [Candidatus Electrothrix sp. GW3-3]
MPQQSKTTLAFLPTTRKELHQLGWDRPDIILVSGDAYIDSPFIGTAVIGRVLADAGFRVGIIAQPDLQGEDICRLGEPRLFWGVSGGCVDSMVANRTASGKHRKQDDYTPGGINNRRPDRAVLIYANLIRSKFKNTCPIVLGGIEASLRRIAHYDYWSKSVRRSILLDAKADFLLYGMAERAVLELATALRDDTDPYTIRGLCYPASERPEGHLLLPSYEEAKGDTPQGKKAFTRMFRRFYENNDPITAQGLAQLHGTRWLIQNPPQPHLSPEELDHFHSLDYQLDLHPFHQQQGNVRALETIRFSLATHRGCYGECNFCAIAVHQGRTIVQRTRKSILAEAHRLLKHPGFKGRIHDVGGPTANMYGVECRKKRTKGACLEKRCLFPEKCKALQVDHSEQLRLLEELRQLKGVKQVVVSSGIRYDLILADQRNGLTYLRQVVRHHVSGQMKVAPEHCQDNVLACMGKPGRDSLLRFRDLFNKMSAQEGLKQFLTYYIIAAHPGCRQQDMQAMKNFAQQELKVLPRQVQIFTPTPSTWSTLMYWTGENPLSGQPCFVEKDNQAREQQKAVLTGPAQSPHKRQGQNRTFAPKNRQKAGAGTRKKGKFTPRRRKG